MTKEQLMYNRLAWNQNVSKNNIYTQPVNKDQIEKARKGKVEITLSRYKLIPNNWLPSDLNGKKVLALAAGGGQQAILLASAGAEVTLVDNSDLQVATDIRIASREKLFIETHIGNMMELSFLKSNYFDIVINPISTLYINDVEKMYKEVSRVLKKGGIFLSGFMNPIRFAVEYVEGGIKINKKIPFDSLRDLNKHELAFMKMRQIPITYGHSLESLMRGQMRNGFVILDLFEDKIDDLLDNYIQTSIVTLARKEN